MSRIGKKPVAMPSGVTATIEGQTLTVKGPKGTLSMALMDDLVSYKVEEGQISVQPLTQAQRNRAREHFDDPVHGQQGSCALRAVGHARSPAPVGPCAKGGIPYGIPPFAQGPTGAGERA